MKEYEDAFPGCIVSVEDFTPERAAAVLTKNEGNRKLRDGVAEAYGLDMEAGRWNTCTDAIVFYKDGALANGQHRMEAIVLSGTTQRFIVVRGVNRKDGLTIDRGTPRRLVDNARISGVSTHLSNELIAVTRAIEDGDVSGLVRTRPLTDIERVEMVERHLDAAMWAIAHSPKGRAINNAIVKAAIARAWYVEEDKERLAYFCEVLASGQSSGTRDSAAITIRNYLFGMQQKGQQPASSILWRDTFLKIQAAIRYFMRGERLVVIKVQSDEWYPIAGKVITKQTIPTTVRGRRSLAQVERAAAKEKK